MLCCAQDVGHRNNVAVCLLSMSRPREAVLVLEELERKVKEEAEVTSSRQTHAGGSKQFELSSQGRD